MRAFNAVDLFVDVDLDMVLLSDCGDGVDLFPEIFIVIDSRIGD